MAFQWFILHIIKTFGKILILQPKTRLKLSLRKVQVLTKKLIVFQATISRAKLLRTLNHVWNWKISWYSYYPENYRVSQKECYFCQALSFDLGRGVFRGKKWFWELWKPKKYRVFSKILSKWTFSIRKMQKIFCLYEFMVLLKMENIFKCHESQYLWICT